MKLSEFPEHTVIKYQGSRYIKTPSIWEPFLADDMHLTYTEVDYFQRTNPDEFEILATSWDVVQTLIAGIQELLRSHDAVRESDIPTQEEVLRDTMDTVAEAKKLNLDITPEQKKEAARLRAQEGKS